MLHRSRPGLLLALLIGSLVACFSTSAQITPPAFIQLVRQQDSLFWKGYNNCDTALEGKFLAEDVEFYHDKGGVLTGKKALLESLKKNLCSNPNFHLRREAKAGTVTIWPLTNNGEPYGAYITGEHFFYITQNGEKEFRDGHARFTELWLLVNGVWKMKQIMSYDHGPAAKGDK